MNYVSVLFMCNLISHVELYFRHHSICFGYILNSCIVFYHKGRSLIKMMVKVLLNLPCWGFPLISLS